MHRYRPIPLLKLLKEMMLYSNAAVDLAFYTIAFKDQATAYEVAQLDKQVEAMWEDAVTQAVLAARSVDEALKLVSVFRVLNALQSVSRVASDFASLVLMGLEPPELLRRALLSGAEVTAPYRVTSRVETGVLEERFGVDVVAVRRGGEWLLNPPDNFVLEKGDVAIVRGSPENVARLTGLKLESFRSGSDVENETLRLKKLADVILELGFYSILYGDEVLAHKVLEIEHRLDQDIIFYYEEIARLGLNPRQEFVLHKFAETVESISDAAASMAALVKTHSPIHTVIAEAEDELTERIVALTYHGKPRRLDETSLVREEVIVLAVRKHDRWLPTPGRTLILENGDVVIVKVYAEQINEVLEELKHSGFEAKIRVVD